MSVAVQDTLQKCKILLCFRKMPKITPAENDKTRARYQLGLGGKHKIFLHFWLSMAYYLVLFSALHGHPMIREWTCMFFKATCICYHLTLLFACSMLLWNGRKEILKHAVLIPLCFCKTSRINAC